MNRSHLAHSFKQAMSEALKHFRTFIRFGAAAMPSQPRTRAMAEKAVSAASRHFYRIIDLGGSSEPMELRASVMAQKLVMDTVIGAPNKNRAGELIFQVLKNRDTMAGPELAKASMESQVVEALLGAGIAIL